MSPTQQQSARPDATERLQREVKRDTNRTEDQRPNPALDDVRGSNGDFQQRRVESTPESAYVSDRSRVDEDEGLTRGARRALEAFASNSPSPEQRLGIELAGIDTYA